MITIAEREQQLLAQLRDHAHQSASIIDELAVLMDQRSAALPYRICARCGEKFNTSELPRPVTPRGKRMWDCPGCLRATGRHLKMRLCSVYNVRGVSRFVVDRLVDTPRRRGNYVQVTPVFGRPNEWYLYYVVRSGSISDFKSYIEGHGGEINALMSEPFWPPDALPV